MSTNRLRPDKDPGQRDPLAATGSTPWVAVRVVSGTVFCPRAGLIAHELGQVDDGEERDAERSPRLDWLPDYDEDLINQALQQRWNEVWWVCHWAAWWILVCFVVFFAYEHALGLFLAAPLLVVVYWLSNQSIAIAELDRRRKAAASAENSLKISDLGQEEREVNWWQLRKAGFSLVKPQEPNRDPIWRLAGQPFAILEYQSLRIPVFRKHRGKHEVHSQNRARIAAYCHLIEVSEGAQSPFGVMLFAGSYDVFVIPNSPRSRSIFHNGLVDAREVILASSQGDIPGEPSGNQCSNCPLGFPRRHKPGETDTHLSVLLGTYTPQQAADGHEYHSVCGDRFEWLPPHNRVEEKRLRDE